MTPQDLTCGLSQWCTAAISHLVHAAPKDVHACAEDGGKHSRKRGRPEEASSAGDGTIEDAAPQNKVSRIGRAIVAPALREEALTPAPTVPAGRSKGRVAADAGIAETAFEEAMKAQQKGRRKRKQSARRVEWPPAAAEQLAAAQKVRLSWSNINLRQTVANTHSLGSMSSEF